MKIQEVFLKIDNFDFGFDIQKAEEKAMMVGELIDYVENQLKTNPNSIGYAEIEESLRRVYGLAYEIGHTKQYLESKRDRVLVHKALEIGRIIFKDNKQGLLPYLRLVVAYTDYESEEYKQLQKEINELGKLEQK